MNKTITTDYDERAAKMRAAEQEALARELRRQFDEFVALAGVSKSAAVRGVNVAREMGAQIEMFTGHEKLLPAEFVSLAPALPDASLEFAKACLMLHHKFTAPVTDYAQAAPEWERLLVQLELLPRGQRTPTEHPPLNEPLKDWLARVIRVKTEALKLERELPPEKWDDFFRDAFLREFAPLVGLYERLKK